MLRILGFKTEATAERATDWVHVCSADAFRDNGEVSHSTWIEVKRLVPPEHIEDGDQLAVMKARWAIVEPAYEAWKAGQKLPEKGTPLGAWHGISQEQADSLRNIGIASVEDLAGASENTLARPPIPGMRELKRQAEEYLKGADSAAMARKIADLEAQNAAMLEMLAEQKAEAADKPKRGRPPKVKEEA